MSAITLIPLEELLSIIDSAKAELQRYIDDPYKAPELVAEWRARYNAIAYIELRAKEIKPHSTLVNGWKG